MTTDYVRGKSYKIQTRTGVFEILITAVDEKFITGVDKNGVEVSIRRDLIL